MNMTSHTQAVRHSQQRGAASRYLPIGAGDSAWMEANPIATDLQDRIEAWVNEGGAGDDLDR
jgi:hypothetical protein